MDKKQHKFMINEDVLKSYKHLCIDLDISMGLQTEQLILQFIQVQKDNVKIQRQLRKMEKIKNEM